MSALILGTEDRRLPTLTLEEQLAKCRYSFEYPITVEVNDSTIKLINRGSASGKSGIALKVTEPVRVEFLLETILTAVQALTNMANEKRVG